MTNIYNEGAPHLASGLAKSTLTAFFDSRSEAETAIEKLKSAGVSDLRLMPGYEADVEGPATAVEGSGFGPGSPAGSFPMKTATSTPKGSAVVGFSCPRP